MTRLPTRRAALAAGSAGLAVLLIVGWLVWWGRPPQMGPDEDVFRTVDALFTAVTARDEKLLGDCEHRLHACKDAGKLPGDASDYLEGVLKRARDGRWESAARRLYGFMQVQRRAGTHGRRTREKNKEGRLP